MWPQGHSICSVTGTHAPVLVLVGPPGAGKSTVGGVLAERLGVDFADVDERVVARAGRSIADIFAEDGEATFRELEGAEVATALACYPGVLALGGGAVLSESTRAALRGHRVAFLEVGMAEGVRRTGLSTARPLLTGLNPRATFKALLDERLPLYREVSTVEVPTEQRTPPEVAEAVLAALPIDTRDGVR